MPCRNDEEDMQLHPKSGGTYSSTPPENDGAGHAESDDDGVSTEDDDHAELQLPVKKKRRNAAPCCAPSGNKSLHSTSE